MKTIEEKAKEYAKKITPLAAYSTGLVFDAYVAAATDALTSQWHHVKDGYPQCDNDVFVAHKSRFTDTIMYGVASYYKNEWYTSDDNITTSNIFAWMYIPRTP